MEQKPAADGGAKRLMAAAARPLRNNLLLLPVPPQQQPPPKQQQLRTRGAGGRYGSRLPPAQSPPPQSPPAQRLRAATARPSPPVTPAALPHVGGHTTTREQRQTGAQQEPARTLQTPPQLWAWRENVLNDTFEKAREEAVLVRRRKGLRDGRAAAAEQDWERADALFRNGIAAVSPAGEQSVIAELQAALAAVESAQEARDEARLEASRISLQARQAHQNRRYDRAVTIWRSVLPLDIQDKGWSAEIRCELARAEAALAAQTNARLQVTTHCVCATAHMAARRYEAAVAEYERAQTHDAVINDVNLEASVLDGLDKAVAAVEKRNAARAAARQHLDAARGLARAQSWERAIEASRAELVGRAIFDHASLEAELQASLESCLAALSARNDAREQAAQLNNTADARFQANDYTAAADHYQAAADLDTQDAELTSQLSARVHLSLASHELSEGRTCMVSHRWESGIECFERGLQQHETALAAGAGGVEVLRELREGVSTCESRIAARDEARVFAASNCRTGKQAAESRDYRVAVAAFKAASEADVQDAALSAELAQALAAAETALEELEATRAQARRLTADAEHALVSRRGVEAVAIYEQVLGLEIFDDELSTRLHSGSVCFSVSLTAVMRYTILS